MTAPLKPQAARKRQAITAAAQDLFLAHGFLGANMDDIAAQAGVSKQTVYAHFQSKESLFLEVVGSMTGGAGDAVVHAVPFPAENEPAETFLLNYALRQLTIVLTPPLMRLRRLVIGEVERFPSLGVTLHQHGPSRAIDTIARAIAHYQAKGALAATDPLSAASFFNWLVMGAPINDAMLLGDAAIPDAAALEAHARESVRVFMAAYVAGNSVSET